MTLFVTNTTNCFLALIGGMGDLHLYIYIVPVLLFIEAPFYILVLLSLLKKIIEEVNTPVNKHLNYFPKVSCLITCYNEKEAVVKTVRTLAEQLYNGVVEIFILIDGSNINQITLSYAKSVAAEFKGNSRRKIFVIPKVTRGGLVSSRNLGLKLATGEIVIAIDGDSSCDNDMVMNITRNFYDGNVVGASGFLRVRNFKKNILTRLQGIEYIHGIQVGRLGLGNMNLINNISGAFGAFKRKTLEKIGGWRTGTAEDLDLTLRIKSLGRRYPKMKMIYDYRAVVHTDVPETLKDLIKQRLRWDGDLLFIYFSRYRKVIRPKFLGWKIFFGLFWYNILFCVIAPVSTVLYLFYLILFFPLPYICAVLLFIYLYYFTVCFLTYIIYLIGISERKLLDLANVWLIVFFPVYQFLMRIVSTVAFVVEFFLKTHKNSNMAPWWVLKKAEGKIDEN